MAVPVHIFSVCAQLSQVNFTKTEATGDASLSATLMCLFGKCLYQGTHDFGKFSIPL